MRRIHLWWKLTKRLIGFIRLFVSPPSRYPPHWVSIDLLHQAMAERGFAILSPGTDLNSGAPALGSEHCVLKDFDEHGRKISKPAANCNCSC
jgi:hypothetical protein